MMKNAFSRLSLVVALLAFAAVPRLRGQGETLPSPRPPAMTDLEQIIEDEVQDAGRRQTLIRRGKEIDSREMTLEMTVEEFAGKLAELNRRYDATRDQFDDLDVEYSDRINTQRRRLAKMVIEMQGDAGRQEWRRIGEALAQGAPAGFGMAPGHALERFVNNMRENIVRTVPEKARRREILPLVDIIGTELSGYERSLKETASRTADIIRQRGATWEQFDREFTRLANDWTGALNRCLEMRFSLRNCVSRDEWRKIFPSGKTESGR